MKISGLSVGTKGSPKKRHYPRGQIGTTEGVRGRERIDIRHCQQSRRKRRKGGGRNTIWEGVAVLKCPPNPGPSCVSPRWKEKRRQMFLILPPRRAVPPTLFQKDPWPFVSSSSDDGVISNTRQQVLLPLVQFAQQQVRFYSLPNRFNFVSKIAFFYLDVSLAQNGHSLMAPLSSII